MAGQTTEGKTRGFLKPVIGGLVLIGGLIAAVYYKSDVWRGVKWVGNESGTFLTDWVPDHPGQAFAIGIFAALAFAVNWFSHVRGRLGAWVFAIIVEAGLWLLFWYGLIIPPLNEVLGLNITRLSFTGVALSGVLVIGLTGVVFWLLEAREEWKKYRRRHNADGTD